VLALAPAAAITLAIDGTAVATLVVSSLTLLLVLISVLKPDRATRPTLIQHDAQNKL